MSAIVIQKISKSFGATSVLQDISLTIKDGAFVSLLGPSGCGKSTLLRLIAGLDVAERGSIVVGQHDVTRLLPKDRDLAMVFQSYALYPHLSVYDNIAVPLRMRRLNAWQRLPGVRLFSRLQQKIEREIRQDIHEVAATLGIEALLPRKPAQLSGGQRQRVALGRAMVRKPEAFFFEAKGDIPGSHEPPAYGVVLMNGETILVHTHDFLDQSLKFSLGEQTPQAV